MGTIVDLTGRRFGRLTVVRAHGINKHGQAMWECLCDCGNTKITIGSGMKVGNVRSCGCLKKEGHRGNCDIGDSSTQLYSRWCQIKSMCINPSNAQWYLYGGKGVHLCDDWMDFRNFKRWMLAQGYKEGMYLFRIDKSKDYCPENCILSENRIPNPTSRIIVEYNGETRNLREWAEITGIPYNTLKWRYSHGRTGDSLFTKEMNVKYRHTKRGHVPDSENTDNPDTRETS